MSVQRVSHLGICVLDPERSLAFYRDLLGFRRVSELALSGEPSATLLRLPGVDFRAIYLGIDATWDPLRERPRFIELLERLGLPQA